MTVDVERRIADNAATISKLTPHVLPDARFKTGFPSSERIFAFFVYKKRFVYSDLIKYVGSNLSIFV